MMRLNHYLLLREATGMHICLNRMRTPAWEMPLHEYREGVPEAITNEK
jgi:hypothetical protein